MRARRPKSIALFSKFYLAAIALSAANIVTSYEGLRSYAISQGLAAAGPFLALSLGLLSGLLFWYFIARRASNVAKWLLIVFSALSLTGIPAAIMYSRMLGWVYATTFTASGVALVAALTMLLRKDSVEWLTNREPQAPVDPAVFG